MRPPAGLAALLLAAALAAAPAGAQDVEVRAHLEPEVMAPGDDAFFSIEVAGGVFDRVDFEPDFELLNFRAIGGPTRSHNVRWINGVTHRSLRLTWRLRAEDFGFAAVRRISVRVGGERFDLPSKQVRVVTDPPATGRRPPAGQPQRPSWRFPDTLEEMWRQRAERRAAERPEIRLVAETTPRRPWAGQQVTYTLWLYTQTSIHQVSLKELPEFRGFWVEEVPGADGRRQEAVEVDGETFYRTPLLQRALFPLRPGQYRIDPAEVFLVARLVPTHPFAPVLPRAEQIVRASEPLTLDVRPLPPLPPDLAGRWHGLVGDVALDARLVPSELAVGDASTLEVELTGRGNVEGLDLPEPRLPPEVDALPPEETGGNRLEGTRVTARRAWSFPLVPREPGTWRLPPLELAYFDPEAGEYRLAATDALVLRARRGGPRESRTGGPVLHPLKNAALPLEEDPVAPWRSALPWLFALPWALVLGTSLLRRRRGAGAAGDAGPYARFAEQVEAAANEERPRRAAMAMEAAWRDLLAVSRALPAEMPPSRWHQHLRATGADERELAQLDELVEDLHYLRHAPQLSTIAELAGGLADRSRRLGRRLAAR